jgi:oligoendopeptidase F
VSKNQHAKAVADAPAHLSSQAPDAIRWDLTSIFPNVDAARASLAEILSRAAAFESAYRNQVAGLDPERLSAALTDLGLIQNDFMRVDQYTDLRFSTDSRDTDTKDLLDTCAKGREELSNRLRFFDLEWQAVPADQAARLTADAHLAMYRHYLEKLTAYAPHMRAEAEEAMLVAREAAAISEWQRLFGENLNKIEVEFDAGKGPEPHTLDRLFALSRHPERDVRFAAFELAYAQLAPRVDVQAACYNAIVGDRLQIDRIRGFESPMQQTNLANDLPDEVVNLLVTSVQEHYPLAQRWFTLKAKLLGLPKLHLFDQYAPIGVPAEMSFGDAWRVFTDATAKFSPEVNTLLSPFLDDGRIDAQPRVGKSGGAFCAPVAWGDEPFMLMNFTDDIYSAETLAHEAGHGLQFILIGQKQQPLNGWMGLAMAEVASTFHETVFVDHILERESNPEQRLLLSAKAIETVCATVFRQVMMTGYERRAYAMKADGKALTADRLSEIWLDENRRFYGDSVELPAAYRLGWSYIPHFIDTRFYTYAYSFAHLASMALYARYRQEGVSFVPRYLDLIGAGGAVSPQALLARGGIDVSDPSWVAGSFAELERMIDMAAQTI